MTHLHDKPHRTAEQSAAAWLLLILIGLVGGQLVLIYLLGGAQRSASDTADQLQRASQNQPRVLYAPKDCRCAASGGCLCCPCQEVK